MNTVKRAELHFKMRKIMSWLYNSRVWCMKNADIINQYGWMVKNSNVDILLLSDFVNKLSTMKIERQQEIRRQHTTYHII